MIVKEVYKVIVYIKIKVCDYFRYFKNYLYLFIYFFYVGNYRYIY